MSKDSNEKIFGYDWAHIQALQQKKRPRQTVQVHDVKDYGCDPVGDGTFRMIPSGDIVTFEEMKARRGLKF